MPGKVNEERVAREVADTLVKEDRVERKRADNAVAFVMASGDVKRTDGLQVYRAVRRHLRLSEPPPPPGDDDDDDGRPTLELGPRAKPHRKGTRKDTPVAKRSPK